MKPSAPVLLRVLALLVLLPAGWVSAFDYSGHRIINRLAIESLPNDFPSFVKEPDSVERIQFLSGEPDRWRNSKDRTLRHFNNPDHFIDIEDLAVLGIDPKSLPPRRYEFVMEVAAARARRAPELPILDAENDPDRIKELPGFLPWSIAESFAKLKSAFSYLKAYEEAGTLEEILNARRNVIHYMGVLGHYVGDAAQPLHTTVHFNGWTGANPAGFTTSRGFHAWIDGGYVAKMGPTAGELLPRVRTARVVRGADAAASDDGLFSEALEFVLAQHQLVVPLYQMDKDGRLTPDDPNGAEGKAFFETQFLTGGQMLGDLWLTAWRESTPDTFLKAYLARRKLAKVDPES